MATNLSAQISALAVQIGTDIKGILGNIGSLESLTTNQKASLVLALNELKASIDSVQSSMGAQIDDESNDKTHTWSGSKISSAISAATAALVDGAPDTLDTLKELSDALTTNKDAISALQTIAAGHVKFNESQTLEPGQQEQARTNIGAAAASDVTDLQGTVSGHTTQIGTIGDLTTTAKNNLVAAINEVKGAADQAQSTASSAQTAAGTAQETATAAQSAATANTSAISDLTTKVGDTKADFAAQYVAARDGE